MNLHPHSEHGEAERPKESMNMEQLVQVKCHKLKEVEQHAMNYLFIRAKCKIPLNLIVIFVQCHMRRAVEYMCNNCFDFKDCVAVSGNLAFVIDNKQVSKRARVKT